MFEGLDNTIVNMHLKDRNHKQSANVNGHECNFVRYLLK